MTTSVDTQKNKLSSLGIILDIPTGHLFYDIDFRPLKLSYDLLFVRHGETFGNCGQITKEGKIDKNLVDLNLKNSEHRIFQGRVDEEINQLTTLGIWQANHVAQIIEKEYLHEGWQPDSIFHSPLLRAKSTGLPFIERNSLWAKYHVHPGITEMSFGCWDNRRVCDFEIENECHLFYKDQNALIKKTGINGNGLHQDAESFCDVIIRAYDVLKDLNSSYEGKKIIFFSHSMFGAACSILLGKCQSIENDSYLAFDGKRKDGTSYIMPHTSPVMLNKTSPING